MSPTLTDRAAHARILVALDESPRSVAALSAATALAVELGAELAGLFIEDVDLQHLIGLPFAREFSLLSGTGRPLSQDELERTWRRDARALQRQLAEAAERKRLRWSFRVARGRGFAEVTTQAQAFDLVVLGKRTGIGIMTVTQTTSRLAAAPATRRGAVVVLLEDPAASANSLDLGARLARRNAAELVLLVSATSDEAYQAACAAAQKRLEERGIPGRCVWLHALDAASLVSATRREAAGCLVLAHRERFLTQTGFERALDSLDCPIMLTR